MFDGERLRGTGTGGAAVASRVRRTGAYLRCIPCRPPSRASTAGSDKPSVAAPSVVEPDVVWMTVGKDRQPVMVFYPELLASSRPCIPASMIGESVGCSGINFEDAHCRTR